MRRTLHAVAAAASAQHGAEVRRAAAGRRGGLDDLAGSGIGRVGAGRRLVIVLQFKCKSTPELRSEMQFTQYLLQKRQTFRFR